MILTLVVFGAAVLLWVCTPLDDTFVALAAVAALLLSGVLPASALTALGGSTTWLLVAAFVLAAGVAATGLPARLATWLVGRARTVRGLAHLTAFALLLTAFFVPSTSGRAALTLPVYDELRDRLNERAGRALGVLFPSVILLTAVATLVGAGAHLITNSLLEAATGQGIGFGWWLLLGVPLAAVSAHVTAEIVLWLFTSRADRATPVSVPELELGGLTRSEIIAVAVVLAVAAAWLTEPWHHVPPEVVALTGALVITTPRLGTTTFRDAFSGIPWSLLLFMAATTVLGTALISSGAANLVAGLVSPAHLLPTVIVTSLLAHLVIQSRSARSSVLVPLVIPLAAAAGMNPAALAFASTAAAGFCHTLTSSAKPVALFAHAYRPRDLLRLSVVLAPVTGLLVFAAAVLLWPHLGLPLR
ncbi:SLC13 family permease [Lentzea sp. BCCO 10_0856]|uniref:SLC13 family permease n=1 Tax=Lentzea miocenica TaxID=3095431 RepID=A0ABU4TB90_9PSEU|nr:SLC13 family permease [Lentzea sp. BCCO 10_0856]MDX8035435.1 SLC13 family permease [Lentzea sp. BCCO 10_0856]